ncbi:MAG: GxxExxY protein [Polaromonas sp.]|nr:GxxExxY protein [Polaromonas sp.]
MTEKIFEQEDQEVKELNRLTAFVIGAAIEVHRQLGPGLLESVYEACVYSELKSLGVQVQRQVTLPITYKGVVFEDGMRLDLLVGKLLIVELKAVEALLPIHSAQVITYLKLSKLPAGLLLNFNVTALRQGIKRLYASNAYPGIPPLAPAMEKLKQGATASSNAYPGIPPLAS